MTTNALYVLLFFQENANKFKILFLFINFV